MSQKGCTSATFWFLGWWLWWKGTQGSLMDEENMRFYCASLPCPQNMFTGQTRSPAFSYNHVSVSCVLFHICGWIRPVFHSDCLNSTADLCDTIYIYMYMIGVWCVYIQIDRVICRQPKVWQASRRKMRSGQTSQTKKPHQTMSQRSFSLKAQPNRRDGAQDLSKQIYRNVIKCKYTHAWRYSYI